MHNYSCTIVLLNLDDDVCLGANLLDTIDFPYTTKIPISILFFVDVDKIFDTPSYLERFAVSFHLNAHIFILLHPL